MDFRYGRRDIFWVPLGLALLSSVTTSVFAQTQPAAPPVPAPTIPAVSAPGALPSGTVASPLPAPAAIPSAPAPAAVSNGPQAVLEDRIRQLEAMVSQLSGQVQQLSTMAPAAGSAASASSSGVLPRGTAPARSAGIATESGTVSTVPATTGTAASMATPSRAGGAGAPGQSLPPNPAPTARFDSPATLARVPGNFMFGPGFELRTDDDEFVFQFHNLTQFEYRGYAQGGQTNVHDTFAFPRQWFMFSGRISKPIGYFVSFAEGFDTMNMLDVFIDINYNPKIQGRIGRMKTPFTYEFLVEPIQGLLLPERSVFFNNFGQNRDVGAMAYGRIVDNTVDYAVGVWNGTRNGFLGNSDGKAVSAFVNWKPFNNEQDSILENFNVGGSVFAGNYWGTPIPQTLRTVVPISGNAILGTPFLGFNSNVIQAGHMAFWDLHMAWFYKQLAVIGEWASGNQDYALSSNTVQRTGVPVQSFYVEAGYLLTGETRSNVGIVKPLQPFDLRKGIRGPGAWELVGRVEYMDIGNQVFTAGLSDPNNWANRMWITDAGFNWHLTQYLKLYFDWQHAEFNQPILFAPGRRQLTADTFIVRLQLFF
jgi:phosphate-selective porin OprO/OprP